MDSWTIVGVMAPDKARQSIREHSHCKARLPSKGKALLICLPSGPTLRFRWYAHKILCEVSNGD